MYREYEILRDSRKTTDCWKSMNDNCIQHFHASIELCYVISGEMDVCVNGKHYIVKEQELILSTSYSLHQYTSIVEDTQTMIMTIPLDFVPSLKETLTEYKFSNIYIRLEDNHLLKYLLLLEKECHEEKNVMLIKGYTYVIIGMLTNLLGLEHIQEVSSNEFSRNVLLYLDEHFLEELDVHEVAHHFGYSKNYFLRLFTLYFGVSYNKYLYQLKCRHAVSLMKQQKFSITESALQSGFSNMRSFYRHFNREYKMSPNEYIKK